MVPGFPSMHKRTLVAACATALLATQAWRSVAYFRTAIRDTRGGKTAIVNAEDLPLRGFDKSRGPPVSYSALQVRRWGTCRQTSCPAAQFLASTYLFRPA